jgi:hypothetical protein
MIHVGGRRTTAPTVTCERLVRAVGVRRDRDGLLNDELPPAAGAAETSFGR